MERTISAMIGKGSVNHNTRAFTAKNVDKNRSADNVEFCQEDIKQVYHKLFDEALERYNAKQKRKDRMIDNYYEKIRRGKQEKLFHEVIFQIGNKDDMNAKNEDGLLAKRILRNLWMSSKLEIRTCMYSRHICIWMKKHRICTLILYHILQEVSEDLIQGYH